MTKAKPLAHTMEVEILASLVSTPFRAQVEGILWTWLFQKSSSTRCLARKVHTLLLLNVWLKRFARVSSSRPSSSCSISDWTACSRTDSAASWKRFAIAVLIYPSFQFSPFLCPLRNISSAALFEQKCPPFFLTGNASSLMAASATSSREAAPPEGLSAWNFFAAGRPVVVDERGRLFAGSFFKHTFLLVGRAYNLVRSFVHHPFDHSFYHDF